MERSGVPFHRAHNSQNCSKESVEDAETWFSPLATHPPKKVQ